MKIDLSTLDTTQFMVHDHVLNGEIVKLVQPQHIGAKWSKNNLHFRSSVWNNEGVLISAGFSKFFNWGEKPDISPVPTDLRGAVVTEKLDGSLLIVSKYKGEFILRTRGTVDASSLDNGHELEVFKQKYPNVFTFQSLFDTWPFTLLFEWTSPNQRIVLSYGDEPEWSLVGYIGHDEGENNPAYWIGQQCWLDALSKEFGCPRPAYYTFTTVDDLLANVELWKGKEGVVVYSGGGQMLHKVKCFEYLKKHRFKSDATLENTVELFFSFGMPEYGDFEKKLIESFDYECFEMVRGFISNICDGYKNVQKIVKGITQFVEPLKSLPRKDAAQSILSSYGTTGRSNMAFTLLDSKPLSSEQSKKLLYQSLKS